MSKSNTKEGVKITKLPKAKTVGVFANAIQIHSDTGDDVLLDFLVYSESANQAEVVSRLRVNKTFLPALHRRLGEILGPDLTAMPVPVPVSGTIH